ncbi:hypothetical protein [Inediibacterium massiliense]|uniref:hypothetical protein n=1 Tax=Inediibacterium massiliense TaxID=1658111 RepID=UPI0018FE1B41|nr:hypothetical protein [Inediibacterium massiliense]
MKKDREKSYSFPLSHYLFPKLSYQLYFQFLIDKRNFKEIKNGDFGMSFLHTKNGRLENGGFGENE